MDASRVSDAVRAADQAANTMNVHSFGVETNSQIAELSFDFMFGPNDIL